MASKTKRSLGAAAREALLVWYRPRRRAYPWRRPHPDPYGVLVSEVMLQQTQAERIAPAFEAFMRTFPDVGVLAEASSADVLRAWAGLGYNRRAVALHEAVRGIVRDHAGRVPDDLGALLALPGVGPYTAAAVASIAYGVPVAAVDTNVRRVVARVALGVEPDERPAAELAAVAQRWLDRGDPATWNSAMMDLGRAICRPRIPRCAMCPLERGCRFRAAGLIGRASTRPHPSFEGSFRQVRGRVVASLRARPWATVEQLAQLTGQDVDRVTASVRALERDGLVQWDMVRVRLAR